MSQSVLRRFSLKVLAHHEDMGSAVSGDAAFQRRGHSQGRDCPEQWKPLAGNSKAFS